jgi:hypothetical protein
VFIKDPGELWDELGNLAHITTEILNDWTADGPSIPAPGPGVPWRRTLGGMIVATG